MHYKFYFAYYNVIFLCSVLLYDSPDELVAFAATLMFFSFFFWSVIFSLISFVFTVIYGIDNYKTTSDSGVFNATQPRFFPSYKLHL